MQIIKHTLDGASFVTAVATVAGWLPPLAALLSILWILFQFWHSAPFKKWRAKRRTP